VTGVHDLRQFSSRIPVDGNRAPTARPARLIFKSEDQWTKLQQKKEETAYFGTQCGCAVKSPWTNPIW
jgi:hypothetical protein